MWRRTPRDADGTPGVEYVDLATCLLGENGAPDPGLYAENGLHLDEAGYARWAPTLRRALLAVLADEAKGMP